MATTSTSTNGLPLVQLRGYERLYSAIDGASTKVAHVALLRGSTSQLLAHLPTAIAHVFSLHPRMRVLLTREPAQHVEIQPLLALEDVVKRQLLRVRETSSDEEAKNAWQTHVQEESMRAFDRYEEFPAFLEVWADRDGQFARLFLFSDHYMFDGLSGMTVLNDVLSRVAQLAQGEEVKNEELPLRKSPYECLLDMFTLPPPLSDFAVQMPDHMVHHVLCQVKPIVPLRANQADYAYPFKVNPSYAKFATGDAANLKPILARCKQEKVTYTGAVSAAVVLAYYYVTQKYNKVAFNEDFKVTMSVSANLRTRFANPVDEDVVGSYHSLLTQDRLVQSGVKLETKFWDLARERKADINAGLQSPLMVVPDMIMDQHHTTETAPKVFSQYKIPNSCAGDVDLSNIGRYPYNLSYLLGGESTLTIDTLHLYESIPGVGFATLAFVSTTDKFNYSMMHKYEDEDGDELFRAYVAFAERIGNIDPDATLADVYTSVVADLHAQKA